MRVRRALQRLSALSLLAALAAGCGLDEQTAPGFIGPSEFGLAITATATPDQLPRDGRSQSVVTVTVRDVSGALVSGQRLALSLGAAPGTLLSQSELTTGSDGRASFAVVAPPASSIGSSAITVGITPVGTNAENAATRTLSISLTGAPNASAPTPSFTVNPTSPEVGQAVTFNASGTLDEGVACGSSCSFNWNFDDGSTATGPVVTHTFTVARTNNVTLTVTDAAGTTAALSQSVLVSAIGSPSVTISVSPNPPIQDQQATLTASGTAAPGQSIVNYTWNFGDGSTQNTSGPTVIKTFTGTNTRVVTVTARDGGGREGSASLSVTPTTGTGAVTAVATVSPSNAQPASGPALNFDASGSTTSGGASIVEYTWVWGDGTSNTVTTSPQTQHDFTAAGTYVVRLTVRDSLGRTATTTVNVTVTP